MTMKAARQMSATEFKAKCLTVLDDVAAGQREVIVTKRDRPVARVVPLNAAGLEVGYWCHSAHSGRGWTTLATRVLVALAFDRFGCDRFQVIYDEANVGSRRVIEKCGLPYEGTVRNATAVVSPEVRAGGYAGTGRHRMHALTPDDLGSLEWLEGVRANTTTYDALGGVSPRP